jgi:DedD protein
MPPSQLNEQEIQFKKRARRRLVGAIALVLLMVTVLPMVLDDRATKTQQQEIAITIPSQDGTDFTSKVVPVVPVKPLPESKPDNFPGDKTDAGNTVADLPKPQPQNPGKSELAPVKPPAQAEAGKQEIAKSEPAHPESAQVNGENFVVQIGVFSDAANVKKLQQKLQTLGYKSHTEKLTTPKGEKIRLRTAPFASRAQAEDALIAIKDAGLSGMVVMNKQDS